MPVLGAAGAVGGAVVKRGAVIPQGSLDQWRAVHPLHATDRSEAVFLGDSTWWGQADLSGGGSVDSYGGSTAYRSPLAQIRQLSLADGITDGGPGIIGYGDTKEILGLSLDPIVAGRTATQGATMSPTGGQLLSQQGHTIAGTQTIGFQGPYTCARVYCSAVGDSGSFTYSINGGAPTTITPGTAGGWSINYISGMPSGQTNTITFTNVSGNNRIDVELLNATGIVFHKHCCPGAQYTSFVSFPTDSGNNSGIRIALGAGNSTQAALQATEGTHPTARKVRLAVWTLGINDITQIGAQNIITVADKDTPANTRTIQRESSGFTQALDLFLSVTRGVGADPVIVIPHWNVLAGVTTNRFLLTQAITNLAIAQGVALWNANEALGGPLGRWSTNYYSPGNAHLKAAAYNALGTAFYNDIIASS